MSNHWGIYKLGGTQVVIIKANKDDSVKWYVDINREGGYSRYYGSNAPTMLLAAIGAYIKIMIGGSQ